MVSAMQNGDLKAYGVLFRRYYPMLCTYAAKFVGLKDAEEITQDVMLWLWENRETQTFETSLSQYLFKTVYHRAINTIIHHQSRLRAELFFTKICKRCYKTPISTNSKNCKKGSTRR